MKLALDRCWDIAREMERKRERKGEIKRDGKKEKEMDVINEGPLIRVNGAECVTDIGLHGAALSAALSRTRGGAIRSVYRGSFR